MSELLQQIKNKIDQGEKQFVDLQSELQAKKKLLAEKKAQQERAILAGTDTGKLVAEIVELQIEAEGIRGALTTLGKNLDVFRSEKISEAQKLALARAEANKTECLEICQAIYFSLSESINGASQLKEKYSEYVSNMRAAKQKESHFDHIISTLIARLREVLSAPLESFPKAIFADGKLKPPEVLKKSFLR